MKIYIYIKFKKIHKKSKLQGKHSRSYQKQEDFDTTVLTIHPTQTR